MATAACGLIGEAEEYLPRVASCFGGGLGREGEVCGALSGALIAVGLRYGRRPGDDREARGRAYQRAANIVRAFRERFGAVRCRELIQIDLNQDEGREMYRRKNIHDKYCVEFVRAAVVEAYKAITS